LIVAYDLNFINLCRKSYYDESVEKRANPPDDSNFISMHLALNILNNDIELLLKSMISGLVRYRQLSLNEGTKNVLLFLPDLRALVQKIKGVPEGPEIIEVCTMAELIHRFQSNPALLDKMLHRKWITLICFEPSIMKYYMSDKNLIQRLFNAWYQEGFSEEVFIAKNGTIINKAFGDDHQFFEKKYFHYKTQNGDYYFNFWILELMLSKLLSNGTICKTILLIYESEDLFSLLNHYTSNYKEICFDNIDDQFARGELSIKWDYFSGTRLIHSWEELLIWKEQRL
jgi:hypothetical protein